MKNKLYIQTDLLMFCYTFLLRKKRNPSLWDLLWTMHKVAQKLDYINKNSKDKKVIFRRGICIVNKNWLSKFGQR